MCGCSLNAIGWANFALGAGASWPADVVPRVCKLELRGFPFWPAPETRLR